MCGWQKSDLEHKFKPKWTGDNRLGNLIKERIVRSWDAFVEWFNAVGDVDVDTLRTTIKQAEDLEKCNLVELAACNLVIGIGGV